MPQPVHKSGGDSLTVISSAGLRLTKVWDSATGKPQGYEKAQQVSVQERHVQDIFALGQLLDELESERNSCIIRGKFIGHSRARELYPQEIEQDAKRGKTLRAPKDGYTLRRLTFFKEQPLHFFYIDIDKFRPVGLDPVLEPEAAIEQYITQSLPECFQGITYHWQLSSGAGHPDNPGVLKAHVAFWLSRAHVGEDLDAWVKAKNLPIDVTVFRTVQPNYTAAPVFVNGVKDPVPRRSGLCEGFLGDEVDLQIDPGILLRAKTERKSRLDMVDPRDKDNLVGQFCRAFEIEEVVERWLPDVFEFVTENRLTWLKSDSGAAEGAGVTDNRQGIFNTHNGDPFNARAANKWDLVRHYVYGHLDAGLDGFERFSTHISELPSELAMREMVATLPEMQAETIRAADTHHQAIAAAPNEASLREIIQRIGLDGSLDRAARETLSQALRERWGQVMQGKKPTLKTIGSLMAGARQVPGATKPRVPAWAIPWCYVTSQAKFFNVRTKEVVTREAFDAQHCRLLEPNEDGAVPSAAKVACDEWHIPTVYNTMYLPSQGDLFCLDGVDYANLYRPESAPTPVRDAEGEAVIHRHLVLTVPDATYRRQLLEWMAWVVRNPGFKVNWAVLLKGVEGDGKSVLGTMLAMAMGHLNVGIVSPETMAGSNFNDWAVGRCVNVIEELKLQGHNRHDVYNKIKPLITNPRIEVHGKGKAATTAVNTANYMGFSNHTDALPLDDNDRRQFVLFTPWLHIRDQNQAIEALGLTVDRYWDELWDVVKNRPEVVRGYFEAVDITAFNPHGRAPATSFKAKVVAAGDLDDAETYARALIEDGCLGVSQQVISSSCLSRALAAMDPPVTLMTTRVRRLLESLGFEAVPGVLKWAPYGAQRVWVKAAPLAGTSWLQPEGKAELRRLLDSTVVGDAEDFLK